MKVKDAEEMVGEAYQGAWPSGLSYPIGNYFPFLLLYRLTPEIKIDWI